MSEKAERDRRPQQVTLAAIVAGSSAAVILVSVGSRLASWNSVDARESFEKILSEDDLGRRLGISLGDAMGLAKVGMFVAGALAAAIVVLAVFAARRDKGARIAMSVLALPMLLVGLLVDGFLAGFVVAGTVLLWSEPARDWYAGRAPRAAPAKNPPAERVAQPTVQPTAQPTVPPPVQPPTSQAPVAGEQSSERPAAYAGSFGQPRPASPPAGPGADPARRPAQVLVACVVTWVMSGAIAIFTLFSLLGTVLPGSRTEVRRRLEQSVLDSSSRESLTRAGIGVDDLLRIAQVMLVLVLVWALVAAVLGVLTFLGHDWARITLIVSAGVAALLGLLGVLGALVLLVVTVGCLFAISRLVSRPAAQWYAARARR